MTSYLTRLWSSYMCWSDRRVCWACPNSNHHHLPDTGMTLKTPRQKERHMELPSLLSSLKDVALKNLSKQSVTHLVELCLRAGLRTGTQTEGRRGEQTCTKEQAWPRFLRAAKSPGLKNQNCRHDLTALRRSTETTTCFSYHHPEELSNTA